MLEEVFRELWTMSGAELGTHGVSFCSVFRDQMTSILRRRDRGWEDHFKMLLLPFMQCLERRDGETKSSPQLLEDVLSWAQQLNQVRLLDDNSDAALLKDWCLQLCQSISCAGFRNFRSGDHARILGPAWAQHLDDPEGPCATAFVRFLDQGLDYSVETGDATWVDLLPEEWIICERNLSGTQSHFVEQLYFTFSMWLLPSFGPWKLPPERSVSAVANELFLQANPQVIVDLMLADSQAPSLPRNRSQQKPLVRIQFNQLYQARMFTVTQVNDLHDVFSSAAAMTVAERNTFSLMARLDGSFGDPVGLREKADSYGAVYEGDPIASEYSRLLSRAADYVENVAVRT